jgi:hypothetical protein
MVTWGKIILVVSGIIATGESLIIYIGAETLVF